MGVSLIAYLAAAVAAAAHPGAAPARVPSSLSARPLHGMVVPRARPGGKPLVRVGPLGVLGGPLVFGVVAVRGSWVEFGRDVTVRPVRWRLRVSLSRRALFVFHGRRLVRTIPVGIGRPGSPTPLGRFAVAEKVTGFFGPAFGCCILALTARQPRLPAGWNRQLTYYVAIHAGIGEGSAVSAGCLHATEAEVRYLMRTIPLGTGVRVTR